MQEMLTFISEHEPTLDEFLDWMIESYPKVNSRKTAQGYLDVPRLSRLAEFREDRLALTADGATYLASGDPEDLYRTLTANIAGVEESLQHIKQEPCTIGQLTKYLNETIGTTWETDAQATWRVQWLESFGKVKKDGDLFVAVATTQPSGPNG
jgi:hypothetical protein